VGTNGSGVWNGSCLRRDTRRRLIKCAERSTAGRAAGSAESIKDRKGSGREEYIARRQGGVFAALSTVRERRLEVLS